MALHEMKGRPTNYINLALPPARTLKHLASFAP